MGFIGQEQGHFEVLPSGPGDPPERERLPIAAPPASRPVQPPPLRVEDPNSDPDPAVQPGAPVPSSF
jgi:hypothetical protein